MRGTTSVASVMRRGAREESGFALVVALLVTMISFILVTAVLAQAMHNVTQSGYLRKRTAAIHAAEAGLSWFSHVLENTTLQALSTSPWTYSGGWWSRTVSEVASQPDGATFTIRVKYTATDVCLTAPCTATGLTPLPLTNPVPEPIYAIVRSIGTANGVSRALESAVRLHAETGGVDAAMGVIGTSLCFDSGASLEIPVGSVHVLDLPPGGWPTTFPDNCKINDVLVDNGNKLDLQNGSLLVDDQGFTVTNGGEFKVTGDLWAEGAISLGGGGGNIVDECGVNTICVGGDAIGSSVTIGSGAAVLGDLVECDPACPPTATSFPILTADPANWTNWTIVNVATSTAALTAMTSASTKTAYIISSTSPASCNTLFDGSYTINVDVAIVSSCRFEISGNTQGGTAKDEIRGSGSITLVSAWPGTAAAPAAQPSCTGTRDITVSTNPTLEQPVFFYTPCTLVLENNSTAPLTGQFVARFIFLKNGTKLSVVNLIGDAASVPGLVSGFKQDIRYVKEILPTSALGA